MAITLSSSTLVTVFGGSGFMVEMVQTTKARPIVEVADGLLQFVVAAPLAPAGASEAPRDELSEALADIDPDIMPPREAMEALYRLEALTMSSKSG